MDLFGDLSLDQQIYKCGGSEKVHLLLFLHYLSLPFPHSSPCFSANIYMQDLKWWPATIAPLSGALIASLLDATPTLYLPRHLFSLPPFPPQANRVCVIVRLGVFVIVYSRFANFFFLYFSWLPLHLVVTLRDTTMLPSPPTRRPCLQVAWYVLFNHFPLLHSSLCVPAAPSCILASL